MPYLDSSRSSSPDSLEYIYSLVLTARGYDNVGQPDSANNFYLKAEPLVRSLGSKEPLHFFLLYRAFHLDRKRERDEAKRMVLECLTIIDDDDYQSNYLRSHIYKTLAENGLISRDLDSVYFYITKMNQYLEKDPTKGISPHHFNTMAWYYYVTGDLGTALKTLKGYFEWYGIDLTEMKPEHAGIVGNISITYIQLGDFERAEKYQQAILEMLEKYGEEESHTYQEQLNTLATIYVNLERYDEALALYDRQIAIYKRLNKDYLTNYYYGEILVEKGQALAGSKRWDEAEAIYNEILIYAKTHEDLALENIYLYKGMSEELAHRFEDALESLLMTLSIQKAKEQDGAFAYVPTYSNIAMAYQGLGRYDLAIAYMDSALSVNQNSPTFQPDSLGKIAVLRWQVELINDKLELLKEYWNQSNDEQVLELAFRTVEEGNIIIDYARKILVSDESKLRIAEDFYQYALYFNVLGYDKSKDESFLWKALSFNENNKSFLLNSLINQHLLSDDPEYLSLLDKREEMKQMINTASAQGDIQNQYKYLALLDSVQLAVDRVIEYSHFRIIDKAWMKKNYQDKVVLSTHVGKEQLYFFLIQDHEIALKQLPIDENFKDELLSYRTMLSHSDSEIKELTWNAELAQWLSSYEIEKDLIIVPDGVLNWLPFEALSDINGNYLMESYDISYLHSLSQPNVERQKSVQKPLISYAPSFDASPLIASADIVRNGMSSLPGAYQEALEATEILGGEAYTKTDATEGAFRNTAQNAEIIHLATHAIVDDFDPELSKLVFYTNGDSLDDGYLHTYEIYAMDLNAELVTLSACNTGYGQIKKGEGVMSLSRAFAYAGVPSAVVSLWPASDKSTPELMKYFYQNLKDGQSKDVALNNARKQYLSTAKGKARHPFYWGGFVLIGDSQPIARQSNWIIYLMGLSLIIVIGAVALKKKRA